MIDVRDVSSGVENSTELAGPLWDIIVSRRVSPTIAAWTLLRMATTILISSGVDAGTAAKVLKDLYSHYNTPRDTQAPSA